MVAVVGGHRGGAYGGGVGSIVRSDRWVLSSGRGSDGAIDSGLGGVTGSVFGVRGDVVLQWRGMVGAVGCLLLMVLVLACAADARKRGGNCCLPGFTVGAGTLC